MDTVKLKINGIEVEAPAGSTIIQAANLAGVKIPSLCYLKDLNELGACRICMVEATGAKGLVASCVYPVSEGMEVFTNTEKVRNARKMTLELLLSDHRMECLTCRRNGTCELQDLAKDFGIEEVRFQNEKPKPKIEDSALHLVRDNSKCILCRRCVAACDNQGVGVIGCNERGFATEVGSPFGRGLVETACISCGQCIVNCPTGALTERDDTGKVWAALNDETKHVVIATAPSVRAGLGECFGMPIGTNVEGKMVAALRRLGFDWVFDTDFSADLTIMEEGNELVGRVKKYLELAKAGKSAADAQREAHLPILTSCCPGWINFLEHHFPDLLDIPSSCKSPQQMFGAVAKSYYAEKTGVKPEDLIVVSVMPCQAKKYEAARPEFAPGGVKDVDYVVTTRELVRLLHEVFKRVKCGRHSAGTGYIAGPWLISRVIHCVAHRPDVIIDHIDVVDAHRVEHLAASVLHDGRVARGDGAAGPVTQVGCHPDAALFSLGDRIGRRNDKTGGKRRQ